MTAGNFSLTIEQGATFSLVITYKDSAGSAINLTGFTARMSLRTFIEDSSAILTLTTENGRIALGGGAGTVTLTVSASDTAALTAGNGVYDLELISSGGVVTRLIEGSYSIVREVTR
tara:strand:+ start:748 stop:1098 length:351 start_codon:yes stop_codon:yes gene_type:complete